MIGVALLLLQVAGDTVRGTVVDAATRLPVAGAEVATRGRAVRTDAGGRFLVVAAAGDTLVVRRLGYRQARVRASTGVAEVALVPAAVPLAAVTVQAASAAVGHLRLSRDAATVRAGGATSAYELVAALPLVSVRSAPGRALVSVRGARAEQVLVTLDGMPLNDPATGIADVADVPLAAVGSAAVVPGADAVTYGSGASGGVVALASAERAQLTVLTGSFGRRAADGALRRAVGGGWVRVGGAWSAARNDFPFRNLAAAPGTDSVERRVNNDETRRAAFVSALLPGAQVLLLASDAERGLVGPMNVREYDDDRGRTRRVAARASGGRDGWRWTAGARLLRNTYRDARHPAVDSDAGSASAEADVARAIGSVVLRAGAGADRVAATQLAPRVRPRAFAAAAHQASVAGVEASTAVRVDAVRDAGAYLVPSLALERHGAVGLSARVARGFRVPSFYDLYFASPQRVVVRDLRPERVVLDAELSARTGRGPLSLAASVFERRTRDAIVWFPGNFSWSPTNAPLERARGAEVHATAAGPATELDAWAAVYDARLRIGTLVVPTPYVPRAAAGATLAATRGAWTARVRLAATGRRPFANAPADRSLELPGTLLASASAGYRVRPLRALLFLGTDNLGDVPWESVRRYPSPGRTWSAGLTIDP